MLEAWSSAWDTLGRQRGHQEVETNGGYLGHWVCVCALKGDVENLAPSSFSLSRHVHKVSSDMPVCPARMLPHCWLAAG